MSATVRAALASVATAVVLIALKSFAAHRTGSVAMLASLVDSALDLAASLVTLWGVHVAAQPADRTHRFGHGKAEALAALFQVAVIAASAAGIAWAAAGQFVAGARPAGAEAGIVVSLAAMAVTGLLLAYQRRVIAATGSLAIGADNLHYRSDLMLNGAVIAALLLDRWLGWAAADPLFGIAIALWLGWGAWGSAVRAIDELMDHEWPEERRQAFLKVAATHPELAGIHDLRTRTSGARDFVQFHAWVDGAMTLADAHRVIDAVERRLEAAFPGVEVIIHPDPTGHHDLPAGSPQERDLTVGLG